MKEERVKREVKRLLERYGAWYFMPVPGGFGRAGIPDFIGCHEGKFFSVETKSPTGRTTRLQEITMDQIRDSGGQAFVVVGIEPSGGMAGLEAWLAGPRR